MGSGDQSATEDRRITTTEDGPPQLTPKRLIQDFKQMTTAREPEIIIFSNADGQEGVSLVNLLCFLTIVKNLMFSACHCRIMFDY